MSDAVPRLHVDIDAELHRRAKIVAARRDLTMKKLITEAVEQFVEEAEEDEGRS
jgi:predicted transcriptional regulator